jgi:hypothetical protein
VVYPQDLAQVTSEVTGVTVTVMEPDSAPASPPAGAASFTVVSTAVQDLTGRPPQTILDFISAHRSEVLAGR